MRISELSFSSGRLSPKATLATHQSQRWLYSHFTIVPLAFVFLFSSFRVRTGGDSVVVAVGLE